MPRRTAQMLPTWVLCATVGIVSTVSGDPGQPEGMLFGLADGGVALVCLPGWGTTYLAKTVSRGAWVNSVAFRPALEVVVLELFNGKLGLAVVDAAGSKTVWWDLESPNGTKGHLHQVGRVPGDEEGVVAEVSDRVSLADRVGAEGPLPGGYWARLDLRSLRWKAVSEPDLGSLLPIGCSVDLGMENPTDVAKAFSPLLGNRPIPENPLILRQWLGEVLVGQKLISEDSGRFGSRIVTTPESMKDTVLLAGKRWVLVRASKGLRLLALEGKVLRVLYESPASFGSGDDRLLQPTVVEFLDVDPKGLCQKGRSK